MFNDKLCKCEFMRSMFYLKPLYTYSLPHPSFFVYHTRLLCTPNSHISAVAAAAATLLEVSETWAHMQPYILPSGEQDSPEIRVMVCFSCVHTHQAHATLLTYACVVNF